SSRWRRSESRPDGLWPVKSADEKRSGAPCISRGQSSPGARCAGGVLSWTDRPQPQSDSIARHVTEQRANDTGWFVPCGTVPDFNSFLRLPRRSLHCLARLRNSFILQELCAHAVVKQSSICYILSSSLILYT